MSIYSIGLIPRGIGAEKDKTQQRIIYLGYVIAAIVLIFIYLVGPLASFFSLSKVSFISIIIAVGLGYFGTAIQYVLARYKVANKIWTVIRKS